MTDLNLVQQLEERSRQAPDRVVRLQGTVQNARAQNEPFELLIFRGFSSSTTHPTAYDPDASVLPEGTLIERAELLKGPIHPTESVVLIGPIAPAELLAQTSW